MRDKKTRLYTNEGVFQNVSSFFRAPAEQAANKAPNEKDQKTSTSIIVFLRSGGREVLGGVNGEEGREMG